MLMEVVEWQARRVLVMKACRVMARLDEAGMASPGLDGTDKFRYGPVGQAGNGATRSGESGRGAVRKNVVWQARLG